jgi:hypothetical protein
MSRTFGFDFAPGFRPLLLAVRADPANSYVRVTDEGTFEARFGFVRLATPVGNISCARKTGPYRWWRAIGIRSSLKDRGLTFGSSTLGVCIVFREPVRAEPDFMKARPALTVTVADRDGLIAAIEAAQR